MPIWIGSGRRDEMLWRASIPSYPSSTGRYNLDPRAIDMELLGLVL
jgi:hypothetical protein